MDSRKLHKSSTDKAIAGVCGGIAEYFGIDSVIIRLLFVLFALGFGSGLLIYIICAIVMPDEHRIDYNADYSNGSDYSNTYSGSNTYAEYTSSASGSYSSFENGNGSADGSESEASYQNRAANSSYTGQGENNTYGSYTQPQYTERKNEKHGNRNFGIVLVAAAAVITLKYFIPRIPDALMAAVILLLLGLFFIFKKR